MTIARFAPKATSRKPLSAVPAPDASSQVPDRPSRRTRRARLCPTPHLTANQYLRLLACIDDAGGIATLDELSRALPRVRQPISAVFDLCDAGVLNVDWESAFDGDMRVWRLDR